jgi:hypothetical protein
MLKGQFRANKYNLLEQNCNHFTEAFLMQVVGKQLPSYVNRLAKTGSKYRPRTRIPKCPAVA